MTSIFDGMAGVIGGILGAPVIYRPKVGPAVPLCSIFREDPVEVIDGDGHAVRSVNPRWEVSRALTDRPSHGDQIEVADGRIFEIAAVVPSGSPAHDAFWICDLYEVPS